MLVIARVYKNLIEQPLVEWVNTYEFDTPASSLEITNGNIEELANGLVSFEETLHLSSTRFNRVVISTYESDTKPYDPTKLVTVPRDDVGDISTAFDEAESLDTCLFVRRRPQSGRAGKLMYRNCLLRSQVETKNGQVALSSDAALVLAGRLQLAMAFLPSGESGQMVKIGQSLINTFYPATPAGVKQVPLKAYNEVPHIVNVIGLEVAGVKRIQLENAYYDRSK